MTMYLGCQERFKKNVSKAPHGDRVIVIKGDSMLSLATLVAGGAAEIFDVICADGSHEVCELSCERAFGWFTIPSCCCRVLVGVLTLNIRV